jgi:hypothetical protein
MVQETTIRELEQMHKKGIALAFFVILILLLPVYILAQNEENFETETESLKSEGLSESELIKAMNLTDPFPEGIYKIGNFSIQFIPPKGWKMVRQDSSSSEYAAIQFMPPEFTMTSLRISILPFSAASDVGATVLLENMLKEEASKDHSVSEQSMIKFADTDAATWVTKLGGMKTKQIQFFKGINMFMITFGAEDQDFDKLMPVIKESLNSFKIISSDSK